MTIINNRRINWICTQGIINPKIKKKAKSDPKIMTGRVYGIYREHVTALLSKGQTLTSKAKLLYDTRMSGCTGLLLVVLPVGGAWLSLSMFIWRKLSCRASKPHQLPAQAETEVKDSKLRTGCSDYFQLSVSPYVRTCTEISIHPRYPSKMSLQLVCLN